MWHKGLITKLISFKFSEYLTVIRNFLTKRKFQVRVNQVLSSIGDIHAGTPQGSSLSPTLYNIFTVDLPKNDNILNCLFADDSAILPQGSNIKYVIHSLQLQLNEIEKRCTLWRVAINTEKTKAILFRKGHSNKPLKSLTFLVEVLSWDHQVKYLGLILDHKLTFQQHARYNCDKF
ncbi:RNA-directed DNA polymerase from mobile element jockey [Araneus ventricosus]|uniref:RNA-directed DNA polymerase from mobile element jockey n=1 Tax=Araneus ventricosus TaxID=182803 RepID=A0A4Y2ECZ2_ARAVE|nr:RNA-directed DNA polymerase from mobile element jockey [Araneus ventricosus]